jgi:hypothetical protein
LNNFSTTFFNFMNNFVDSLVVQNKVNKIENGYSDSVFNKLSIDFLDLLNNYDKNQVKAKSFFTFDQQIFSFLYNPKDQDFNKNYEFVFSGCSQTHGDHVSPPLAQSGNHKNIWGFQIADNYNKEVLNLGMGGFSAQSILKGLINHFVKNGNPKVLFVLYPDFGRIEGVDSDKLKMETVLNEVEIIQHWYLDSSDDKRLDKISLLPHDPINVIPWHFALYHNLQAIILLDQYCKQNNIYFKYFSWDYTSNIILKLLKEHFNEYSNYCEPDTLDFSEQTFQNMTCHKDIKDMHSKDLWNVGIDKEHIGIHQHTHIAEMFLKELKNDNTWN